jgi:DNA-binding beta-propeller fold protein YncE
MNDASVIVVDMKDGAVLKVLPNIPTARGVSVASDVSRIFVTSSPDQLVMIDSKSLAEVGRVKTGRSPDGVSWDPVHRVVGVSDQADGAVSLIADSGTGVRVQVSLGTETGNVVFDPTRNVFWISVVGKSPPDQLVLIDPVQKKATTKIDLPGCDGAHGLRIHPDAKSAFVACEGNNKLARVDLDGSHAVVTAATGDGPDVLSIDAGLGSLYVAAESGDMIMVDIRQPGLVVKGREHPGDHAHSVAVDPATHRIFFPLMAGGQGTPVLRIMLPSGA